MRNSTKVAAFAAGLAVIFAAAYGAGTLTGGSTPAPAHRTDHAEPSILQLDSPISAPSPRAPIGFRITDPRGRALTAFETGHEQRLHLIVVTDDLVDYQHLHPVLGADGSWSTIANLARPGGYRLIADYTPAGAEQTVSTARVAVPGDYAPRALPAPSNSAEVDGYTVAVTGALTAGAPSTVTATVRRAGRPVTDLQPYLGADGHLVALRAADAEYLHVHPEQSTAAGPDIRFTMQAPTAGEYRMFMDFQHDGAVHTAAFTQFVSAPNGRQNSETEQTHHGH
jgi:hypothetical protein